MRRDPVYSLKMSTACLGVPTEILEPRETWADPAVYDAQALQLADLFRKNFP
jgi:phosphoenolpyruvate carboxykinase (ATP)